MSKDYEDLMKFLEGFTDNPSECVYTEGEEKVANFQFLKDGNLLNVMIKFFDSWTLLGITVEYHFDDRVKALEFANEFNLNNAVSKVVILNDSVAITYNRTPDEDSDILMDINSLISDLENALADAE